MDRFKWGALQYQPENIKRAKKIEWEHIVPASWFGQQRICWREPVCVRKNGEHYKGRKCCEKSDPEFKRFYTDLHNLIPVIGEVNAARRDYRFGEFYPDGRYRFKYHGCEFYISNQYRTVEPGDDLKGLVARAHLYIAEEYNFKLSDSQEKMFKRWNRMYPPSEWEIIWNQEVTKIQGNDNSYITNHRNLCLKS